MIVKYKKFEAKYLKWDTMLSEAGKFASQLGENRLINIAHSDNIVIVVWYWDEE